MAPVGVQGLIIILFAFTVAQDPYPAIGPSPPYWENGGCCYGRVSFSNGQTVTTLPECCVSLVCDNGEIEPRYFGKPGSSGCCEFDGQMYPEGAQLSSYCVPLVCRAGKWVYSNKIEECCKLCTVYNDPHFSTFDGYNYDWHGDCNYTITQTGRGLYPEVGVFSDFRPCFGASSGVSCLHRTTFKNDKHTVITFDHTAPSLFSMSVNGHSFTVPHLGVHPVLSAVTHPVLAWRDGSCVFLAGSSRILVRYCHNHLKVWAYPAHTNELGGLCGHFNFYQNDDMTNRDGTVHPLHPWPEAFPESWKTNDQTDRKCSAPCLYCKETKINPCRAPARKMELLRSRCAARILFVLGRDLSLIHHIDACAWDLCMASQAGVSLPEQDLWLTEVIKIVTDSRLMELTTSGALTPRLSPSTGACAPGARWKRNCNWCTCRPDSTPDCFQTVCPADYQHAAGTDACADDSWWKHDDCNWCRCVNGGHICTYENCTGGTTEPTLPTLSTLPTDEVCFYTLDAGSCGNSQVRYYYNYFYGRCATFTYTGCGGNANNFGSEAECLRVCGHLTAPTTLSTTASPTTPSRPAQCNLQPDSGPCDASVRRYYYNATTDTCELFTYGGCAGNGNNFDSRSVCEAFCAASTVGSSAYTTGGTTGAPVTGTTNKDHCLLSPAIGPCYEPVTRYYYDSNTDTCRTFMYSGCGGNANNYISEHWCLAACSMAASTTASVSTGLPTKCYKDPEVGDCFENLWRWYYNSTQHRCQVFVYGGCDGNDNKFLTKEDCEAACGGQTQSSTTVSPGGNQSCYLPKEPGPCSYPEKRFYYNYEARLCEEFTYSGCGGNRNNYLTIEECWRACSF